MLPGESLPRCGECHRADHNKAAAPIDPAMANDGSPTVWDLMCEGDEGERRNGASHPVNVQSMIRR